MKKLNGLILSLLCASTISGCSLANSRQSSTSSVETPTSSSETVQDVTIVEFNIDESRVDMVDVGTVYTVKTVSAKDSEGKYHIAKTEVTDPKGEAVTLTDNTFKCDKLGVYIVKYTVTYGTDKTMSKAYKVEVSDVSNPEVETDLAEHSIATLGSEFDLSQFTVKDNSGEQITPEVKVYFNDTEITNIENNKITLDQEGCYKVSVTATDSSENELSQDFYVHTLLDFENGYYYNNQWYATEITDEHAYKGTSAYSFDAFAGHASWFNDRSMLGEVQILDSSAQYVSFWIKFENPTYETIMKAIYYDTKVYDVYGDERPEYYQGGYAFTGDVWYKVVVDLTNVVNKYEYQDIADCTPNPTTLNDLPFYFGTWDLINGTNGSVPQKIFIDNIKLTNDPTVDADLEVKPEPPETEYVPGRVTTIDYEFGIYSKVKESEDGWVRDNQYIDYTLAHGTYDNFEPLRPNSEGTLGDAANNKASAEGWRYFSRYNDGIVYAVEAKEHSFVRFDEPSNLAGWLQGDIVVAKYTAATNETVELKNFAVAEGVKGQFACDYQEMQAGDKLFFQFKFQWNDERNIQNPSSIQVAAPLTKGETIQLNAPTDLAVTEGAGKHKFTFTSDVDADHHLGYIYDSTGAVLENYNGFAIANNQEFDFSSLELGTYTLKIKSVGTGIFTDSELSEACTFELSAAATVTLDAVKAYLKDTSNYQNIVPSILNNDNPNVKYGLLAGDTELPTAPSDENGWSGFVANGAGLKVQFIGNKADGYYYSYTAVESGYYYVTERMSSWYAGSTATITTTVGTETISTKTIDVLFNGSTNNAAAVYLEAGETITVLVRLPELSDSLTFSYETINVSFYPCEEEIALPSGYASLNEFFAA